MNDKKETIYPAGVMIFAPHDNAPDFVKGTLIISLAKLNQFCKDNQELLTEYNGAKQLKCQLLEGQKGLYATVDTFKPSPKAESVDLEPKADDLPW